MTVIPFPAEPYVMITSHLIIETKHGTGKSTTLVRHDPPLRVFWLELVEADGCAVVWDGYSYPAALDAASDWAAEDIEIRDRAAATWGRA